MPKYYPVFIHMEGAGVLVVGGGAVARRKIETLLRYGATVNVVSRELDNSLKLLLERGKINLLGPEFHPDHLDGMRLVIAATDDKKTNREVSLAARKKGLLVNAVDQPDDCTFIVPAIVTRGALTIAVSTSGNSPALAACIRKQVERSYGDEYEPYLSILGRARQCLLGLGLTTEENGKIFHELVEGDLLDAVRSRDRRTVEEELRRVLPPEIDIPAICNACLEPAESSEENSGV